MTPRKTFDLSTLNKMQREAVLHEQGPLLVLAGAGSGKTRVIIYRIAQLLRDGVPSDKILGVTFTNKAAKEMRERLQTIVGSSAKQIRLSTFHSLGLAIIKEDLKLANLRPRFVIYDTQDQLGLVRELMRQIQVADRRLDVIRVLEILLKTKRERKDMVDIQSQQNDDYSLAAYELYPRYINQMRAFNAIDFDDLILKAQDILAEPKAQKKWSERYDHLLVDEYQDTSPDQLALIRVLAGQKKNVCVVGDDDQSIYAWRGANANNILNFSQGFPGTREVVLDQNYRSTNAILDLANQVIRKNKKRKPKNLWSAVGKGDPVEIVACESDEDEAQFVADEIGRLVYEGIPHNQIAVLYRSNAQSRLFEQAVATAHLPFQVIGGQAFFDRKEVRDAIAYLSLAYNQRDEVALRRVINTPPRGIGLASVEKLTHYAEQKNISLWQCIQKAAQIHGLSQSALHGCQTLSNIISPFAKQLRATQSGHLSSLAASLFEQLRLRQAILDADDAPNIRTRRLDNLEEVIRTLNRFENNTNGNPLAEFLNNSALSKSDEEKEQEQNKISLMTLHSAKGLEFTYVFLVGAEEDILPHRKSIEEGGSVEEERRLCYVGITRARKKLWITWAKHRIRYGKLVKKGLSRFLEDLPDTLNLIQRQQEAPFNPEQSEQKAVDFFKQMRTQLEID